ncbi:hypothetical protein SAMN05421595_2789 [Austwickia chelonae]|uniref:Uncharacterized protein n=1 Tax=Austwickia chelonae NBRC 105200 TaxID=1184607 RepID=K6UMY0_9MICO|nr:hypothetical protein [Austwickia chelonae]GAB78516.1 hypothetical protein AUCHE_09_01210 [Austwickia chelonae NBRC 105200]SEW40317.1 hypothetical protein SAMN05421595_2789 [Austwickia chelonae]
MTVWGLALTVAVALSMVAGVLVLAVYMGAARRTMAAATGVRVDLSMPPAWALDVAAAQFSVSDWVPVEGDGEVNRQHVGVDHPAVSVAAVPGLRGGSEVHIWLSGWSLRWGLVRHVAVARGQMALLAEVLRAADGAFDAPVPNDESAQVVQVLSQRASGRGSAA